jgi:hypothetical protein
MVWLHLKNIPQRLKPALVHVFNVRTKARTYPRSNDKDNLRSFAALRMEAVADEPGPVSSSQI